jgi:hypothetical protein
MVVNEGVPVAPTHLDVVNVGDGACAILDDGDHLLVLDCGSWHSKTGEREAFVLRSALGSRVSRLHGLVVSHFDQDHWKGLQALGNQLATQRVQHPDRVPDEITIYYPGLSELAVKLVAAFITIQDHIAGVRALGLDEAWTRAPRLPGPKSVPGRGAVVMKPRFAGQYIESGDQRYQVLWPPRVLGHDWDASATQTLEELEVLAPSIPGLEDKLARAYGDGTWAGIAQEEARDEAGGDSSVHQQPKTRSTPNWRYRPVKQGPHSDDPLRLADDADSQKDARHSGDGGVDPFDEVVEAGIAEIPPGLRIEVRRLHNRLAKLNNHLSLVMHSVPPENQIDRLGYSWFLGLGDVQNWSLEQVAQDLKSHYCVALAPHHGTVEVPDEFPGVGRCVLQNGPKHILGRLNHTGSHGHSCDPVDTRNVGSGADLHFESGRCPRRV